MIRTDNDILSTAIKATWKRDAQASVIADGIGVLERDAYLKLVADWKAALAEQVADVREARIKRKGDAGGSWASLRQTRRTDGHELMQVRAAIKEVARRHWRSRQASLAA